MGECCSPSPRLSPIQSPCPDSSSHCNVSVPKSSLVIRPYSAQARGRLGPKTTESKWVNGSTPHPRREKHMLRVSPWLDPQLGIPNQLDPQLVLAPVTRPPPIVTLSVTCPPSSSSCSFSASPQCLLPCGISSACLP